MEDVQIVGKKQVVLCQGSATDVDIWGNAVPGGGGGTAVAGPFMADIVIRRNRGTNTLHMTFERALASINPAAFRCNAALGLYRTWNTRNPSYPFYVCDKCSKGQLCDDGMNQKNCTAGKLCHEGKAQPCAAGRLCGGKTDKELSDGTFAPFQDGLTTETCAAGHLCGGRTARFQDGVTTEACQVGYHCGGDAAPPVDGKSEVRCPRGHKCVNGIKILCGPEEYQDQTGQATCKPCTAPMYTDSDREECFST